MSENKLAVPIAIVIAGLLVGASIYFSRGSAPAVKGPFDNTAAPVTAVDLDPVTASDHIRGNPDAEIIIVEYSDLECPFCKVFHNTMLQVMAEYGKGGKVAWVFRHFPIPSLHSKAPNESYAAECAASLGGNDKFWAFVDGVFAITPSNDGLDPAQLPKIAANIGLDVTAFNSCLSSQKTKAIVDADYASGVKAMAASGQQGTPYSVVITKGGVQTVISGAQPYSFVKSAIDTILAEPK